MAEERKADDEETRTQGLRYLHTRAKQDEERERPSSDTMINGRRSGRQQHQERAEPEEI